VKDFLELLGADSGILCASGAGGKKSVLFASAARHPGRVAFTTTVHSLPPPESLGARLVIAPEGLLHGALEEARDDKFVAYACPGDKPGRMSAVPASSVGTLHAALGFELSLVKADGARMRWVKAPANDEPVVPPEITTLVPVLSARALGEPLSQRIAHRAERLAALTGAKPGEPFTPLHAARLLASEAGLLKGAGTARVVPVINMVDDDTRRCLALETAELALKATKRYDRILLLCLKEPQRIVAVVDRR
jgi:probable selenium-dependent hydroxylase accessory protein YqeC